MGYQKWNGTSARAKEPISLGNLTSGFGNLGHYMAVGEALAEQYNPLAAAFLPYARSFSLMDQMIALPTESNAPEDIVFELPDPVTIQYGGGDDLLYMPIRKLASLIKNRVVSCVDVTSFFIEQTRRLDPLLAIVTVPMYESALRQARILDEELARGVYRGALMCVPFGVKDHHQIDGEPTTYGHIMCVQTTAREELVIRKTYLNTQCRRKKNGALNTHARVSPLSARAVVANYFP